MVDNRPICSSIVINSCVDSKLYFADFREQFFQVINRKVVILGPMNITHEETQVHEQEP